MQSSNYENLGNCQNQIHCADSDGGSTEAGGAGTLQQLFKFVYDTKAGGAGKLQQHFKFVYETKAGGAGTLQQLFRSLIVQRSQINCQLIANRLPIDY